jgi:hypothetical protein
MKTAAKYRAKPKIAVGYFILMAMVVLLTVGKWYGAISGNFILLTDEVYSHISNFSLSIIFCLGIGHLWLLYGVKFRNIVIFGLVMIAANFICETLMPFINIIDIMDAVYGTIGVFISITYLFIVKKCGLVEKSVKAD